MSDCEDSNLGGVLGRYSNGIAGGSFLLDGRVHNVSGISSHWDKVLFNACFYYMTS